MERFIGNAIYLWTWCLAGALMGCIATVSVMASADTDERMTREEWAAEHYDSIQDRVDCVEVANVDEASITLRQYTVRDDKRTVRTWDHKVPRALFPDVSDTDVEICPEHYIN